MKCQNQRHTSQSPYSTEDNPHVEIWRIRSEHYLGGSMESSPVVDSDGIIYFGTIGADSKLYAIYPNGTKKWSYQAGGLLWSTPALAEDGAIYITSYDAKLHALYSSNGTLKWKVSGGDPITSSPAIGDDGTIYFGVMGPDDVGRICAIYPNGTKKWHYDTDFWITSDPAIGEDGIIYIGSGDSGMYAINPNGTLKWRFDTGGYIKGHPSISQDGVIYFNSWDNYLYAVYSNGTLKWRTNTGYGTSGSAAIADDGTIYFFTTTLNAYYPENGTLKWSLDIDGNGGSISPAISADGTIYVCNCEGQYIIAVNPNGTLKWRTKICNLLAASSPIIAEDGTIYVGSTWIDEGHYWHGYLHAFGRGPLNVDAGGPYSGKEGEYVQFTGDVFGGIPPYSYHWDFGDGNYSTQQNPKHKYMKAGDYIATFEVIDDEGNYSSDNASVHIDELPPDPPTVEIVSPKNALYILDNEILSLRMPFIIGKVTITADAYQPDVGINRVEFYIDEELKFTDYEEPYEWIWDEQVFFKHQIKVVAVDNQEASTSDSINVRKFF
jgi:outer membrane protein assembly factor BamB